MREINFRFNLEEEREDMTIKTELDYISLIYPSFSFLLTTLSFNSHNKLFIEKKKKLVQYFSISVISIRRRSW